MSLLATLPFRRLFLFSGIVCLVIIAVLSLLPAQEMARTGAPKQMEHFMAYFGTAIFWAAAFFGMPRTMWRAAVFLVALAGAMEGLQAFSPGRTPQMLDFVFSGAGALLGTALVSVIGRRLPSALR
ncbi:VanZ family protein [Ancylobacter sp. 6x-1]|uniref:VanZ family protein n=1 Tax=Ancylobacter crimeensis TaxID=2579147 RepID=A0ABT0D6P9_9HYPH|nr:VanZ family protein [Ancylobacter crimeensis]MCK0195614.1 VanZ family protein [Ancylobacter crimeensis]